MCKQDLEVSAARSLLLDVDGLANAVVSLLDLVVGVRPVTKRGEDGQSLRVATLLREPTRGLRELQEMSSD